MTTYHVGGSAHVLLAEDHYNKDVCKKREGQYDWHDVAIYWDGQLWRSIPVNHAKIKVYLVFFVFMNDL